MLEQIHAPSIIIPNLFKIASKKIVRGNEYDYTRVNEENSNKGVRAFQVHFIGLNYLRRFFFENENDALEFWDQVHRKDFEYGYFDINPNSVPYFFVTQSLTTGAGTLQNFSVPSTWGLNTTSCIGASGASGSSGTLTGTRFSGAGAGAGACASGMAKSIPIGGTAQYQIGAAGVLSSSDGGDTWFGGNIFANAAIAAKGGTTASVNTKGLGGLASACIGTNNHSGGDGGAGKSTTAGFQQGGAGGGGAGGLTGNGVSAIDPASQTNGPAGGNSDTASGGAAANNAPNNGGAGTDFDASHGAGAGGSGGGAVDNTARSGGQGGLYGGAPGGASINSTGGAGVGINGQQGMIFLSYNPFAYTEAYSSG